MELDSLVTKSLDVRGLSTGEKMSRAPKINAAKGLALMGAMLGALAPQATVSQTPGANGPEVRAPQVQNQKRYQR